MFTRPEQNYDVSDENVDGILNDPAQPLARIASLVEDGSYILDIGALSRKHPSRMARCVS